MEWIDITGTGETTLILDIHILFWRVWLTTFHLYLSVFLGVSDRIFRLLLEVVDGSSFILHFFGWNINGSRSVKWIF